MGSETFENFKEKLDILFGIHRTITTVGQLAKAINLSEDYVIRLYKGQRGVPHAALVSISETFGVSTTLWNCDLEVFTRSP